MRTWTVDEMLAEGPCADYTRERIEELWAGREALSLLEILHLDITAEDRVWVACCQDALPEEIRTRWVKGVIERAARNGVKVSSSLAWGVMKLAAWAAWAAAEDAGASRVVERERQVADLLKILEEEQ